MLFLFNLYYVFMPVEAFEKQKELIKLKERLLAVELDFELKKND